MVSFPRTHLLLLTAGLSAPLLLAPLAHGAPTTLPAASPDAPGERTFTVTYTAHVTNLPRAAKHVHIWVPLATTRDGQEVLTRTVRSPVPYTIAQEAEYGNDVLHLTLEAPLPSAVDVVVDYRVTVRGRRVDQDHPSSAVTVEPLERDLQPDALVVLDDKIRAMTHEATVGYATDLERAKGIYSYVIDFMRYDKTVPGWGRGDAQRACELAAGNCTDFHSLFIAMARAAGIPARFKIGMTIPHADAGLISGYHCWAEFHTDELGWVPVDASEAWKDPTKRAYYFGTVDPDKLLISVGRDLRLVPPQQGPPVNLWIAPYVEVDGRPFDGVETQFKFRNSPAAQQEATST